MRISNDFENIFAFRRFNRTSITVKLGRECRSCNQFTKIQFHSPDECVAFLKRQADELGLPVSIYHPSEPTKPVVILTWLGTDPTSESILLNSHMDVVPVYREYWTHEPFGAEIDDEGRIFGRGSQDMKSVGMQYLRAIKALQDRGVQLKRTVHVMYVPGNVNEVLLLLQFLFFETF